MMGKLSETFARNTASLRWSISTLKSKYSGLTIAWKNLKKLSLADSMVITYEAVKELDELDELINWSRVEQH